MRKRLLETEMALDLPMPPPGAEIAAELLPGIAYYDARLTGYRPAGPGPVTGLDAVDQWSVGFYREGVFYAQAHAARRKQTPALPEILQLPQVKGTPAVLVTDVYGHCGVWRMKEEEA